MPQRENDSNLIEKVVKGDPAAFDQIFEKYHRKVYLFSLRNFRNKEDAEGAVQDVFYFRFCSLFLLIHLLNFIG